MAKNPHAAALGKLGGAVKSKRKTEASRKNGRKGGAPTHEEVFRSGFSYGYSLRYSETEAWALYRQSRKKPKEQTS